MVWPPGVLSVSVSPPSVSSSVMRMSRREVMDFL
jgi:hypothetical protein